MLPPESLTDYLDDYGSHFSRAITLPGGPHGFRRVALVLDDTFTCETDARMFADLYTAMIARDNGPEGIVAGVAKRRLQRATEGLAAAVRKYTSAAEATS